MPHIHELYDFVVSVFIVYKNKVLLIYHKKYKEWLPIGGHVELDEDPEEALYREIQEESGLKVRILAHTPPIKHRGVKPLPTPSFVDAHRISKDHKHVAFIYFGVSKSDRVKLHEREHLKFGWFSKEELKSSGLKLVPSIYFYCLEALKAARKGVRWSLLVFLFVSAAANAAPVEYAKVLEVQGDVEVRSSWSIRWTPLLKDAVLQKGCRIKTKPKSHVEISFDPRLERAARLGENSFLRLSGIAPAEIYLERGELFIFGEGDAAALRDPSFKVFTKEALIRVNLGGCILAASPEGTWLKVFGDDAEVLSSAHGPVKPRVVTEGFKFFASARDAGTSLQRMRFTDYAPWLQWIKAFYGKKDDAAADLLDKELASL